MSDWRKTREYRIWRASVIRRDSRCVVCGSLSNRQAHHLEHATYSPSLRFDVGNGVTLYHKCHTNYHTNYHKSFREACTKKSFENFLSLVAYFKSLFNQQEAK